MRSQVQDVMTRQVLAVTPPTPFKEMVSLLTAYRISALPVVNADRHVLGLVSEADLLAPQPQPSSRHAALAPTRHNADHVKAAGQVAADFMHTPAVTITATTSLNQAAKLLQDRNRKRLVVVSDTGELLGIVTRSDLLKVFLRADDEIRREIVHDVLINTLFLDPGRFTVTVRDGVVTLGDTAERRSLVALLVRLIAAIDGVVEVEVEEHLGDDSFGDADDIDDEIPAHARPLRMRTLTAAAPPRP